MNNTVSFLINTFLDAIRIPIEAFKAPFQAVSISRRENANKSTTHAIFSRRQDEDQAYIKMLELQVKNLQQKVDSAKDITFSSTFNGIVIFLCGLTLLSWVGPLLVPVFFGDASSEALTAFIDTCREYATLLPTALISLLGGKVIK